MSSDFIVGKNAVIEALKSERDVNKILIAEGSQKGQMQTVIGLAKQANVLVQFVPKKKLDSLVDANHQGVVAQVAAYQYAEIDDLFALAEKKQETPFFLLLDEIEDPHNLGAIIRVVRVTNMARTIDELKTRGIWIAGTDAKGSEDYRRFDGTMPLGLVIGSEGKGMGRLIKEKCDFLIHLPMAGAVTSLNASVAAALLMYEVYRKRHPLEG